MQKIGLVAIFILFFLIGVGCQPTTGKRIPNPKTSHGTQQVPVPVEEVDYLAENMKLYEMQENSEHAHEDHQKYCYGHFEGLTEQEIQEARAKIYKNKAVNANYVEQ